MKKHIAVRKGVMKQFGVGVVVDMKALSVACTRLHASVLEVKKRVRSVMEEPG